jgi:hypothetical protein
MNRLAPAVLAPYGIPLKVLMPLMPIPRIFPNVVWATTSKTPLDLRKRDTENRCGSWLES